MSDPWIYQVHSEESGYAAGKDVDEKLPVSPVNTAEQLDGPANMRYNQATFIVFNSYNSARRSRRYNQIRRHKRSLSGCIPHSCTKIHLKDECNGNNNLRSVSLLSRHAFVWQANGKVVVSLQGMVANGYCKAGSMRACTQVSAVEVGWSADHLKALMLSSSTIVTPM